MTTFTPGTTYSSFRLKRSQYIEEIDSTVYLFRHEQLGTPALAIKNSDPNKTFCIAFQTVPTDSTGVAHILEHSVLMGSKKYPVKDVFGEIHKGGLMTFLNAMTGSDTTWYPFATRNMKEYFNIMDVYCDVTLNPLLERTTFEQEGWHYHKEAEDQPLQYQGVVFNEMKGAFSDPIRAIFHHMFGGLMPGSTYAHESGGDPRHIPDLTYEQFVAFHRKHYHPANAMLFFYGDAPLEEELAYVQNNFLADFATADAQGRGKVAIEPGREIDEPVFIEDTYGVQPGSDTKEKTFLAVGSAVGDMTQRKRNAAFQIIASILYNSDASPLKKAILKAGLCKDFGGLFLSNSCFKTFMMTYLIGSDPDKRDQFLALYQEVLQTMVDQGLDRELVLAELNRYEFSVREEGNKAQRGLDLISKAMPAMKYGTDPFEALQIDELLREIRRDALESDYFERLIRERLLENPATVAVTLKPDPDKMIRTMQEEQARLAAYEATLDKEGIQNLIRRTRELMELQHQPNDEEKLKLLPRLGLDDLERNIDFHRCTPRDLAQRPFLVNELPTNGIVYLDIGFDCQGLDREQLLALNLFGTIVTEIGTSRLDYMAFAKELGICTGGFHHSFHAHLHLEDPTSPRPTLWFHVKMLSSYLDRALTLLEEVFTDVSFADRSRIREIVQREFAWTEHSVQSEGYGLASTRVFARLGLAGQYNEHVSGAVNYLNLKDLASRYEEREEKFLETLETIRRHAFRRGSVMLAVTAGREDIARLEARMPLVSSLPENRDNTASQLALPDFPTFPARQAFCTSAEVVYNVMGCALFPDPEKYDGQFEVLKTWLSRDYLWNTVRQMGGAYGCFIQFNHISGNFALVSYRDPQIRKTYQAYEAIEEQVRELNLPEPSLEQLIIGTYANFNPHQGPASKGATARNEYLSGITPAYKQQRISEILDTRCADLQGFAPLFKALRTKSSLATIGNIEKIQENKDLFDGIEKL